MAIASFSSMRKINIGAVQELAWAVNKSLPVTLKTRALNLVNLLVSNSRIRQVDHNDEEASIWVSPGLGADIAKMVVVQLMQIIDEDDMKVQAWMVEAMDIEPKLSLVYAKDLCGDDFPKDKLIALQIIDEWRIRMRELYERSKAGKDDRTLDDLENIVNVFRQSLVEKIITNTWTGQRMNITLDE